MLDIKLPGSWPLSPQLQSLKTCFAYFVVARGRSNGEIIHYGDQIGLRFKESGYQGWWLSCGIKCKTSKCPGNAFGSYYPIFEPWSFCIDESFHIFAPQRHGTCEKDTWSFCKGDAIKNGDSVMLFSG